MPTPIKLILSAIVICVAATVYYFQASASQPLTPWVVIALGIVMVIALWLFPETKARGKGFR